MDFTTLLYGLGSIGVFSSRAFLPAFLTALLLRFGDQVPILRSIGVMVHLQHHEPTWFTHNITLVVLGLLAFFEVTSNKSSSARMLIHEIDVYFKPAMAALTSCGVLSQADAHFAGQIVHQAGVGASIVPMLSAIGTFKVAALRRTILRSALATFEGTRIATLLSWLEELWVLFGVLCIFLFAIFMLIAVTAGILGLLVIRKRLEIAEERRRIACARCGKLVYVCATACGSCGEKVTTPFTVGFFGQSTVFPAVDLLRHPYRIVEKRRCPHCATRLPLGRPFEPCPGCNEPRIASDAFVDAYSRYVDERLSKVIAICFVISAVPVLGMIIGTVYYEIALVAPYSQYLPTARRLWLGWKIRLLFVLMAVLQVLPGLGILALPVMAWVSFASHRKSYRAFMLAGPQSKTAANHPPLPA